MMRKTPIREPMTAEKLRSLISYDPLTGALTNLKTGIQYCSIGSQGYIKLGFVALGGPFEAHRLAWLYVHGQWPTRQLDHINENKLDNRIANLREVSNSVNRRNISAARSDNKTGYRGVTKRSGRNKFIATLSRNGRQQYLGEFHTAIEAHEVYRAAVRRLILEETT